MGVIWLIVGGGGRQVRTSEGKVRDRGSKSNGDAVSAGCATVLLDVSPCAMKTSYGGLRRTRVDIHSCFYTSQDLP